MNHAATTPAWVLIGAVGVAVPLFIFAYISGNSICQRVIKEWAASNGYKLLGTKRALFAGPFALVIRPGGLFGRSTTTYYVKLLTHEGAAQEGHIRNAWVRLSSYTGFSNFQVEVRWDERHEQHLLN